MRLTRDTLGNFDTARDPLQRDLATLQRAFDDLQGQLTLATERLTNVEAKTATPPVIIQPNGKVVSPTRRNGTPTQGFGAGGVITGAGLSGNGLSDTPLVVNVDGSTITINSDNALAGAIKKVTIPTAAVSSWLFGLNTTPRTLVAGVAGVTHVPIYCAIYSKITGTGGSYTNGGASFNLHYITGNYNVLPWGTFGGSNLALNTAVASPAINRAWMRDFQVLNTNGVGNGTFTALGKPLLLMTSADISGGSNAVAGLTLLYIDIADNVY